MHVMHCVHGIVRVYNDQFNMTYNVQIGEEEELCL